MFEIRAKLLYIVAELSSGSIRSFMQPSVHSLAGDRQPLIDNISVERTAIGKVDQVASAVQPRAPSVSPLIS